MRIQDGIHKGQISFSSLKQTTLAKDCYNNVFCKLLKNVEGVRHFARCKKFITEMESIKLFIFLWIMVSFPEKNTGIYQLI